MRKWKCTVCGYIHTGDEPPEECPVCGADKSEFVEISGAIDSPPNAEAEVLGEEAVASEPVESGSARVDSPSLYGRVTDLMLKRHAHPIVVHAPNGILPAAIVFLLLALLLNISSFELAAFYNVSFVLLAMPVVIFSGFVEWRKHYKGALTTLFVVKIGCALLGALLIVLLVSWRIINPEVAVPGSPVRWIFFLVHLICLGSVGVAGHLGGKLVWGKK